jgi:octaprenyl-diphosphate synthase
MVDDLLDFWGDSGATGKNIGDDFRERKLTLPLIKAIAAGDDHERTFWKRTIEKGDQQDGDLDYAIELMKRHGALEATRQDAIFWADKARGALATLPDHPIKDMLDRLADYVVARVK